MLFAFCFAVCLLVYLALLHFSYWSLRRKNSKQKGPGQTPFISVVVAAHNEEKRIPILLQSLDAIEYPDDCYEIIIVDDRSTDGTRALIESFCAQRGNRRWFSLKDEPNDFASGKKRALAEAIRMAKGEIIFTTDADCRVPPLWLRNMSTCFDMDVVMVIGRSPFIDGGRWYDPYLQFDNLFSALTAYVSTLYGFPLTSVGRNLAYRKKAYENVGGFKALKDQRSGDDVFLTERIRRSRQGRIVFSDDPSTFVESTPPANTREAWYYQIRKNSKTFRKGWSSIVFSLLLFFFYGYLWVFPLLVPVYWQFWLAGMVMKTLLEYITLKKAAEKFAQPGTVKYLPLMQIIYPIAIVFFTILGSLQLYRWKGK